MPQGKNEAAAQGAIGGASKGAKLGKLAGAGIGAAFGSPQAGAKIGELAGAGIGAGVGAARASKKAKDAERAQNIAMEDPEERRNLEMGRQRLKALQAGTDAATQGEIAGVKQDLKAGLKAFGKAGGPGSLSGMMRMQGQAGRRTNEALSRGQREAMFQQNFVKGMQDQISQRKLDLGLLNRAQSVYDAEASQYANKADAGAAIATGDPEKVAGTVKEGMGGIKGLMSGGGGGGLGGMVNAGTGGGTEGGTAGGGTEGGVFSKMGNMPDLGGLTDLAGGM